MLVHFVIIGADGVTLSAFEVELPRVPGIGESVKYEGALFRISEVLLILQNEAPSFYRVAMAEI